MCKNMQILKCTCNKRELLEKDVREWGQVKFMIENKNLKMSLKHINILLLIYNDLSIS